ncbi:hypothetical protein VNO78_16128 [Psophocarpus tetragonolobus]|uniref:Uncharacterized protein n=1 Tax=Psophocarpus tetragonolobus TaxID=3891 RepID=A0AAN9SFR5_PSOTE
MKAILIAFLLFLSVFFLPSSTLARELKASEKFDQTSSTGDPVTSCTRNPTKPCYPPKKQCPIYTRNC